MRLDKFICKSTELTRTEAKKLLKAKQVLVDGVIVTDAATQITEQQQVSVAGQILTARSFRYLMLNKPSDTLCSNIDELYPSVLHCIDLDKAFSLSIAGRLDADTTGLVLLTDDGQWLHNIISPKKQCFKTYRVWLAEPVPADLAQRFTDGVQLHGEKTLTQPASVELISETEVLLSICEGKYHQVKRMFAALGNKVIALHREQIGELSLDSSLAAGQWRHLTEQEIASFRC
jgi:16S rRNA pseudouridine516 synthase